MQASYIHLDCLPASVPQQGISIRGAKSPPQDESSFESLLQKEASVQEAKAREGPPETQKNGMYSLDRDDQTAVKPVMEPQTDETEAAERLAKAGEASVEVSKKLAAEKKGVLAFQKAAAPQQAEPAQKTSLIETEQQELGDELVIFESKNQAEQNQELQNPIPDAPLFMLDLAQIAGSETVAADFKILASEESEKQKKDTESGDLLLAVFGTEGTANAAQKTVSLKEESEQKNLAPTLAANKKLSHLKEIPVITVKDERTPGLEAKKDAKFIASFSFDGKTEANISLDIKAELINSDGSVQQHSSSNSQQFGTILSAEIQSNAAELVKTGAIVLKDGNKGTINLILHPEELGNVKIRLQISDNILTGRISVTSEEAYNAFKMNLPALREAFVLNGFDTAGFDLSWSGKEGGSDTQSGQGQNPFGSRYDEQLANLPDNDETQAVYTGLGSRTYVNVVV